MVVSGGSQRSATSTDTVTQPTADLSRRMDFVRQVHTNVSDNIRLADTKAGFIAAASVALLNVLNGRAHEPAAATIFGFQTHPLIGQARVLVLAISVATCLLALLFTYFALRPRLPRMGSYVAFPELARMSPEQYLARVDAESDAGLIMELTRDTVVLATIAVRKNQMIGRAIRLLIVAAFGLALVLTR